MMDKSVNDANSIINTAVTEETVKMFGRMISVFFKSLIANGMSEAHALYLTGEYVKGIAASRPNKK